MSYYEAPETTEEALAHFGVLGMKWGKHKARAEAPRAAGYTPGLQSLDRAKFGRNGVDRINEHLNNGMDRASALKAEQRHKTRRTVLLIGAAYAAAMLVTHGPHLAQNAANNFVGKKNAANTTRAAANLLADNKGIGNHKIVDLGFDALTGKWG